MANVAASSHLPWLGAHERDEIGRELQATLVDLISLSLIGKQLHWTVTRPLFQPFHLHLEELVGSWRTLSDTVAERSITLGFVPDGQAQAAADGSQLAPLTRAALADHVVVRALTHRIAEVSGRTRTRMNQLAELDTAELPASFWLGRRAGGMVGSARRAADLLVGLGDGRPLFLTGLQPGSALHWKAARTGTSGNAAGGRKVCTNCDRRRARPAVCRITPSSPGLAVTLVTLIIDIRVC